MDADAKTQSRRGTAAKLGEELPRSFGRLTLLRKIARGGMGEVYLASTGGIVGAERPCVVKVVRREHARDRSFRARFLDEARIQAQFQHPGVATILEADNDSDDNPYHVVEYIEGRNLSEVRQRATKLGVRISWADAVAVAITMADALAHVHERTDAQGRPLDIVHRDLSPQNVMMGYAGDVKLIDFGTARGENRRCQTVAGIVFAKPGYVAPEVANETPGGIPADLYALGVILWELAAGKRFLSGDASEHLAAVAKGERNPPPLAKKLGAPLALDTVIARLTAPRIDDRYHSAGEALTDLLRVLKQAPSLANGERSMRARIAHLMGRLYPAEPARSRAEFARLVALARKRPVSVPPGIPDSPSAPVAAKPAAPPKPASRPEPLSAPASVPPSSARPNSSGNRPPPLPELWAGALQKDEPAPQTLRTAEPPAPPAPAAPAALTPEPAAPVAAPEEEAPVQRQPDQVLAGTRYKLLRRISQGPMGEVWEAYHVDLDRPVALKILPKERAGDFEQRFREEARAVAQLHHENLVQLYDFGLSSDDSAFFAMELLEGESLSERLAQDEHLSWREAALIGVQVCSALTAAHSRGLVHRDIKPANLFLCRNGKVKLLDFGVVKAGCSIETNSDSDGAPLELVGTPEYMAPEQVRAAGEDVDERVDIYALGAVLYELVTGRLPHVAPSTALLLDAKVNTDPDAPTKRAPAITRGLPSMFEQTIERSLARDPQHRYQTAEELREALEHALEEPVRRQRRRRGIAYAMLGTLALAVGLGAFVGSKDPEVRARAQASLGPMIAKFRGQPPAGQAQAAALPVSKTITVQENGTAEVEPTPPGEDLDEAPVANLEELPDNGAEADEAPAEGEVLDLDSPEEQAEGEELAEADPSGGDAEGEDGTATLLEDAGKEKAPPDPKEMEVAAQVQEAQDMMRAGKRIKGLNKLRRIGRNNRKSASALRAWSEGAEELKNWGEAYRVARQWAEVDDGIEAQIHLARLQKSVGKRDAALHTLAKLIDKKPDCMEARELLRVWGGKSKVALR